MSARRAGDPGNDAPALRSVYDGRRHLADIEPGAGGYTVQLANGERLGTFATQRKAADGLFKWLRERVAVAS